MDIRNKKLTSGTGNKNKPPNCCCACMAYNKKIIPLLIEQFDVNNPKSYINTYMQETRQGCLYDWFLADLVIKYNLKWAST